MVIKNLYFFDSNGYNLNFDWNENGYWEGSIYLPKVSVGLYANTSIYVLEKLDSSSFSYTNQYFPVIESIDTSNYNNEYFFPMGNGKITFTWDSLNTFVDEFFMFNFDESYILKETSALIYTPNDGPDCNTVLINKFDTYEIPLESNLNSKALPVHVAFMANEKYDATTYNRTLIMSYNRQTIAKIKFYAETVEEDERLKIWNANLGYNITPEDTMIFYKSDIKEYKPDYQLLNEKRKELMMEGSNIYPYIGSYRAIVNAIKFFGYNNLNIIEYWRNVNQNDENFGKIYHSSKYSLTKKETLRVGARTITLPNKDYKKVNDLALVYTINEPTKEIDELELPLVQEQFTYTLEEALIKLFALRKKLNKEFMPGSSRIIDIIGEANYFTIQGIRKVHDQSYVQEFVSEYKLDFEVEPSQYTHITDNEYFNRYINVRKKYDDDSYSVALRDQMLSDLTSTEISSIENDNGYYTSSGDYIPEVIEWMDNNSKCEYFRKYYQDVFVDYTVSKAIDDNDDYPYDNPEYTYTDPYARFSAKVILKNTSFKDVTFEDCELKFNCVNNQYTSNDINTPGMDPLNLYDDENGHLTDPNPNPPVFTLNGSDITFGNIDDLHRPDLISWKITMSDNQIDEDLKNVGVYKEYVKHDLDALDNTFTVKRYTKTDENVSGEHNYNEFFVELPYVGYYDVTMTLGYNDGSGNMTKPVHKTKKKFIKVEPYQIELIGFYYDARNLPKSLQYEMSEDLYKFIKENITKMSNWAVTERTSGLTDPEFSMPIYSVDDSVINPGPYFNENIDDEWYLADNITYDIAELKPVVKYARYIRNGVDVKPYTWFLLGYEYTKIAGKINPRWTITNNTTGIERNYEGNYLTFLLKKEGNYTITLTLDDKNGNKYSISRNIIVVSKSANYHTYQTFKKEYDYMVEQNDLKALNEYYFDDKEDVE